MGKRYRAPVAPSPLKGRDPGTPRGKCTHSIRVMHRECVTPRTPRRYLLKRYAFAAVEYRGTRPVRVVCADDSEAVVLNAARSAARALSITNEPTEVRLLARCKAVTKKRAETKRQDLHKADIQRYRKCRACESKNPSALCKPRSASTEDRIGAKATASTLRVVSRQDDDRWTQKIHEADINRMGQCRACTSKVLSKACIPAKD